MNIKISSKRGGWIMLFLLAIVFIVVVAVLLVGIYKMAKKIDQNAEFNPTWDQVWREAYEFGSNYASSVGSDNYLVQVDDWKPEGFGVVLRSSDGVTWESYTNTATLAEANNWSANWQAMVPPNDPTKPVTLYHILSVVTNENLGYPTNSAP